MVPVTDKSGKSVHLPTNSLNKYGYAIEFNERGQFDDYTIDYEALAAHIVALHKAGQKQGVGIWRVIFDPRLTANLYSTRHGAYIKNKIEIPTRPSWVRHDEHYHVDFQIGCDRLRINSLQNKNKQTKSGLALLIVTGSSASGS